MILILLKLNYSALTTHFINMLLNFYKKLQFVKTMADYLFEWSIVAERVLQFTSGAIVAQFADIYLAVERDVLSAAVPGHTGGGGPIQQGFMSGRFSISLCCAPKD